MVKGLNSFRFYNPAAKDYPYMIELFSRRIDAIELPEVAVLTHI